MIHLERSGDVAILRLAHGKANLLDLELCLALRRAVEEIEEGDASALVLAGNDSIFCAGVDLKRLVGEGAAYAPPFLRALSDLLEGLLAFSKPLVAAIGGHAIAGGMVIAAAADWRAMARGPGRLGVPELAVGVPFPPAAIELVRFAVPPGALAEFVLECALVDAEGGLARGFLHAVLDPALLLPAAIERAARMAAPGRARVSFTKRQLRGPALAHLRAERARLDPEIERIWSSPEALTAVGDYVARTLGKR